MLNGGESATLKLFPLGLRATIAVTGLVCGTVAGVAYSFPRAVSAWSFHAAHPGSADPSLMNWIVIALSLILAAACGGLCAGGALLGLLLVDAARGRVMAQNFGIAGGAVLGAIPGGMLVSAVLVTNPILSTVVLGGVLAVFFCVVLAVHRTAEQ